MSENFNKNNFSNLCATKKDPRGNEIKKTIDPN